jgi:hypothetical protein
MKWKTLLIATAYNSLTQRVHVELHELGHEISVELALNEAVVSEAAALFQPDLIPTPMLKTPIAEEVWRNYRCIIIHPGPKGDRGPSSLDWAISLRAEKWGITLLQATGEMDAGPIWASVNFPLRLATKSSTAGQATSIAVGPSTGQQTVETYDYDSRTNLLRSQVVKRPAAGPELLKLGYSYFPTCQLGDLSEGNGDFTSQYDSLGRLLGAEYFGPNSLPSTPSWKETYAYDSYGNRLSVSTSGKGPDGSPIPLDGLAGSPTPPNNLSALTYDRKTNRVTTQGFRYDSAGIQTRTMGLDGSWVSYQRALVAHVSCGLAWYSLTPFIEACSYHR